MSDYLLTVDTRAIIANYLYIKSLTKADVAAVVKANSYGLGAIHVTKALEQHCTKFFVARLDEAITLRNNGVTSNIFVLHGFFEGEESEFEHYKLVPVLNSLEQALAWHQYCVSHNKNLPCILHIDTGMNRLGIIERDIEKILELSLDIIYIMSHLAWADNVNSDYNTEQLKKFISYTNFFPGIPRSFSNSHGIFLNSKYHFDLVRPGYALYGLNPTISNINPMQNTFVLTSKILQLKTLDKDEYIGYECKATACKGSKIATIPIGYANGYHTLFTNKGYVYINGKMAKALGKTSMDLITIDVTGIECQTGDKVEIIGPNCKVKDLAQISGISQYEILTSLNLIRHKTYI